MNNLFTKNIEENIATIKAIASMEPIVNKVSTLIIEALTNDKKLLIMGNGGSAADSQHFAAEFTGRYKKERKGLSAIALSTDTSALTAIGNDYGYDFVFSRQVEALAKEGDIVFGISTSGNSKNIIKAFSAAKEIGCTTIGLTGCDGGNIKTCCDINLNIDSTNTPRVQECHILIIHTLCELVENHFYNNEQ